MFLSRKRERKEGTKGVKGGRKRGPEIIFLVLHTNLRWRTTRNPLIESSPKKVGMDPYIYG